MSIERIEQTRTIRGYEVTVAVNNPSVERLVNEDKRLSLLLDLIECAFEEIGQEDE